MDYFRNKRILITGAGTIGGEIARTLFKYKPQTIRILDNSELKLYELNLDLPEKVDFLYGDIRDKERLRKAIVDIDIVFNTAALKHVSVCEMDSIDAIKTNVIGTQNLIEVSLEENIEKMITISTDKAANPISVMGATKLLSEKLVSTCASYAAIHKRTIFASVRFGNVIGSSGSVVPLFRRQIKQGGPITITNLKMTRFIMLTKDAIDLILKATIMTKGGEIFILKMSALRLADLAQAAIEYFAADPEKIGIKTIGHSYGEKIHEELITKEEIEHAYENDEMIIVCSYKPKGFKKAKIKKYSSNNIRMLTIPEIKKLFRE